MVDGLLKDYSRDKIDGKILEDEDGFAVIYENRIGKKYRVNIQDNGEYLSEIVKKREEIID